MDGEAIKGMKKNSWLIKPNRLPVNLSRKLAEQGEGELQDDTYGLREFLCLHLYNLVAKYKIQRARHKLAQLYFSCLAFNKSSLQV